MVNEGEGQMYYITKIDFRSVNEPVFVGLEARALVPVTSASASAWKNGSTSK